MILGFKEFFDTKRQKPTKFKEKILAGPRVRTFKHSGTVYRYNIDEVAAAEAFSECRTFVPPVLPNPKLHTIREDKHDRWKAGMSIQMVYRGAHYKIKDQVNEGISELSKCVSTQKIRIKWTKKSVRIYIDGKLKCYIKASYDLDVNKVVPECSYEHQQFIRTFSLNDGFDHVREFLAWFKKDFTGKIIHWTDLRY